MREICDPVRTPVIVDPATSPLVSCSRGSSRPKASARFAHLCVKHHCSLLGKPSTFKEIQLASHWNRISNGLMYYLDTFAKLRAGAPRYILDVVAAGDVDEKGRGGALFEPIRPWSFPRRRPLPGRAGRVDDPRLSGGGGPTRAGAAQHIPTARCDTPKAPLVRAARRWRQPARATATATQPAV